VDVSLAPHERVQVDLVLVDQALLREGVRELAAPVHEQVTVDCEEAFWEIIRRVVAEGAGDGAATDMGSLLNAGFTDPDGGEHEVVWVKPGVPVEAGMRRAEWSTVEMP